ncbi:hypothetical protein IFU40_13615 [Microbacterium sp. CFBP 13617]|uniref:hypothetical protein n=1 Tax=Microbacterium sp. CFBP 13617 TaxID=2774035 RepID=UPI0017861C48|nr:hypothetical protein [Microbacterium sp. CFBP 13617]MBD8219671.1 hypothetical protein [Microbacterium sp. CFBP 13617]
MASDTESVATAAEKRKKALDLRRAGWSFEDIAAEVGYANKGSAHRAVKQGIAAITRESATELIELELSRLDDLLAGLYEQARNGDLFAVDRALKIMDQRAKFLGLYDHKTDDTSAEVRAALVGFKAALESRYGADDTYGQVTDGDPSPEDVPGDGEPRP